MFAITVLALLTYAYHCDYANMSLPFVIIIVHVCYYYSCMYLVVIVTSINKDQLHT